MKGKLTVTQTAERVLYLIAAALVPNITLFYLYNQNKNQGILFRHCLIFGGALTLFSLLMYLIISKLSFGTARALVVVTILWIAFWTTQIFQEAVSRSFPEFRMRMAATCVLAVIAVLAVVIKKLKIHSVVPNTVAIMICILFAFNFIPGAYWAVFAESKRIASESSGVLPYEIKTEFYVDSKLQTPNIYWLHMDGMIGFEAVEKYFGDSQTELKDDLENLGFVINEGSRIEAGYTILALPALTSPTFYDSFYRKALERTSGLVGIEKSAVIYDIIRKAGFSLDDIFAKTELIKALSEAGYTTIANNNYMPIYMSEDLDVFINKQYAGNNADLDEMFKALSFIQLYTQTSILKGKQKSLNSMVGDTVMGYYISNNNGENLLSKYEELVSEYITGTSDSDGEMAEAVIAMKYAADESNPSFIYFNNLAAHAIYLQNYIGEINYGYTLSNVFPIDENGNYYKERLEDPWDVQLYLPQHKYALKQMMAQIDVILNNDPDAIIVIQADHGRHGHKVYYDYEDMMQRGYSMEDIEALQFQTISAVRIPEKYGTLTEPLDPVDIARYLVNNFVGGDNYEYLYYQKH